MPFAQRLDGMETSAIRELFKLLAKPGIISFAGGFPDASLFDVEGIRAASEQALSADAAGAVLGYGATEGVPALRQALAAEMQRQGVAVQADELIVTTGSQQALDLVAKCMISPGDRVIVEAPTFLAAISCFKLYGAEVVGAPIDAEGVQPDALEALIAEKKPKLIYLIPTFGNPSGATLSLERRLRILQLAAQHQILVIEDDPYGQLYFDAPPPPSLLALSAQVPGSRDWLCYGGSLSKTLAAGLRVGWLLAPAALLAKAVMCKQFSDAHTSNLSQQIAANYLNSGRMEAGLQHARRVYAGRAAALCQGLQRELGAAVDFSPPQGGLFVWARLTGAGGRSTDAAAFARRAVEQLVAFVPGAPFYGQAPDAATFRLSFATASEEKIAEGCARLRAAL
ncbi:MAG: PLP-dependent aminotransferase family protein [Brachymonas sp.]